MQAVPWNLSGNTLILILKRASREVDCGMKDSNIIPISVMEVIWSIFSEVFKVWFLFNVQGYISKCQECTVREPIPHFVIKWPNSQVFI